MFLVICKFLLDRGQKESVGYRIETSIKESNKPEDLFPPGFSELEVGSGFIVSSCLSLVPHVTHQFSAIAIEIRFSGTTMDLSDTCSNDSDGMRHEGLVRRKQMAADYHDECSQPFSEVLRKNLEVLLD